MTAARLPLWPSRWMIEYAGHCAAAGGTAGGGSADSRTRGSRPGAPGSPQRAGGRRPIAARRGPRRPGAGDGRRKGHGPPSRRRRHLAVQRGPRRYRSSLHMRAGAPHSEPSSAAGGVPRGAVPPRSVTIQARPNPDKGGPPDAAARPRGAGQRLPVSRIAAAPDAPALFRCVRGAVERGRVPSLDSAVNAPRTPGGPVTSSRQPAPGPRHLQAARDARAGYDGGAEIISGPPGRCTRCPWRPACPAGEGRLTAP